MKKLMSGLVLLCMLLTLSVGGLAEAEWYTLQWTAGSGLVGTVDGSTYLVCEYSTRNAWEGAPE